jgi:hypothetical protein
MAPKYCVTTPEYESTVGNYDIYTSEVTQKAVFCGTYTVMDNNFSFPNVLG